MVELRINNKSCEFGGLSIVRKNPMFNDIGDYTEPFSLQKTDINKDACNMVDPDARIPDTEPEAEIILFDDTIIKGNAVFESSGNVIGGFIMSGKSHFYSMIKDKTLRDLDCNGIRFPVVAGSFDQERDHAALTLKTANLYDSSICDICAFPVVINENNQFINEWNFELQSFISTRVVPFIRLTAVIRFIALEHGYVIRTNHIMDDPDHQTAVILNNIVVNSVRTEPDGITDKNWSKHLPDYSIKEFIKSIEIATDTTFYFDNSNKELNIISNNFSITDNADDNFNAFRTSDISKKRIYNKNGRAWSWAAPDNDDFAASEDLTDMVIEAEVATEAALPAPSAAELDNIYLVTATDTYWRYIKTGTEESPVYERKRHSTRCGSLKTGLGSYSRAMGFYPIGNYVYEVENMLQMLVPRTDQDQIFSANAKHLSFMPSILFFRGMVNIQPGAGWGLPITYPLGTMYKHDVTGNVIAGANREFASDALENQNPVLNNWYDNPREYFSGSLDLLPYDKLTSIKLFRKYTFNGIDFIFDELKIKADTIGIETIEYGAYRV